MHEKYGVANQDAYRLQRIDDYYCAVVCDGVSLKSDHTFSNSEIASDFCADFVIEYLKENMRKHMDDALTENTLYDCFKATAIALEEELERRQIPFYDCQTTVLMMIFHHGILYGALAGDGGIIFRLANGSYGVLVTKIKTSPSVEPICYPQGWRFATVNDPDNPVTEAVLATDGIFDNLIQAFRGEVALNQALIEELFSIADVHENHKQRALTEIARHIDTHDDKTVVVFIDDQTAASDNLSDQPSDQKAEQQESALHEPEDVKGSD